MNWYKWIFNRLTVLNTESPIEQVDDHNDAEEYLNTIAVWPHKIIG